MCGGRGYSSRSATKYIGMVLAIPLKIRNLQHLIFYSKSDKLSAAPGMLMDFFSSGML